MKAFADHASRCEQTFYHLSVALQEGETLTPLQWEAVADRLAQEHGLEGHQRARVMHLKDGQWHMHVVWNRVDPDTLTAAQLSHDYRVNARVARELERELGLGQVKDRRPEHRAEQRPAQAWEEQQARRMQNDPRDARDTVLDAYRRSDSGRSFEAALAESGFVLCQGDKRSFLALAGDGAFYAIDKRLTGDSAAAIRKRFADIEALPTLDEGRERLREQRQHRKERKGGQDEAPAPEPTPKPAEAWRDAQKPRPEAAGAAKAPEGYQPAPETETPSYAHPSQPEGPSPEQKARQTAEAKAIYRDAARRLHSLEKEKARTLAREGKRLDQALREERGQDRRPGWFAKAAAKLAGRDLNAEREAREQERRQRREAELARIEARYERDAAAILDERKRRMDAARTVWKQEQALRRGFTQAANGNQPRPRQRPKDQKRTQGRGRRHRPEHRNE